MSQPPPPPPPAAAALAADGRIAGNINMKKKSSKEQQLDDAAAKKGAAPPPPAPRRRKKNGTIGNEKKIPKRRRRSSSSNNMADPRPRRPHIPEARVVQEPSDRAYISDSDDWDGDDDQSDFLDPEEERLLQESIARYTTLLTPISHPEFFVTVHRQNNFSDDEGDDL